MSREIQCTVNLIDTYDSPLLSRTLNNACFAPRSVIVVNTLVLDTAYVSYGFCYSSHLAPSRYLPRCDENVFMPLNTAGFKGD